MKKSCPKLKTNKLFFLLLFIPVFLAGYFVSNNLVKASVTSTTPVADFPMVDGEVYATAVSDDGSTLYIGGDFVYVGTYEIGEERLNLAAIDLETLELTDWNPTDWYWEGPVYDIEIDGDYVLIGGGFYYMVGAEEISQFAKLNQETGLVDESCMPEVIRTGDFELETIYDMELTDDYIYLGGDFNRVDEVSVDGLVRIDRDTCQLDHTWLPEPDGPVYAIEAVGNDVLVGGSFTRVNEENTWELAKLDGDNGNWISTCNPVVQSDITLTVYDIEATEEHIYLGGSFRFVKGTIRNGLARLTNDDNCALDHNWNPNPDGPVYTISVDETDNSIYVGGSFDSIGGQTGSEFAKLDIDSGLADEDWNPEVLTSVHEIPEGPVTRSVYSSLMTDNYLIIGGSFNFVGDEELYSLTAFPYELPPSPTPTPEPTSIPTPTPEPTVEPTLTPEPSIEPTSKPKSSKSSKEYIQIPGAIKALFTTALVNKPIKDSNAKGQTVLTIIFPDTFDFNAYLSSNHTTALKLSQIREEIKQVNTSALSNLFIAGWSGGELMGFKDKGTIYWQVSGIQQMFYKAYPAIGKDAPIIIPELQEKDSIIALKYNDADLVPPGEPDTRFNESTLRLAYSLDGINWSVMPSSVVDMVNNTVAAIGKVAGYYTIVGRY